MTMGTASLYYDQLLIVNLICKVSQVQWLILARTRRPERESLSRKEHEVLPGGMHHAVHAFPPIQWAPRTVTPSPHLRNRTRRVPPESKRGARRNDLDRPVTSRPSRVTHSSRWKDRTPLLDEAQVHFPGLVARQTLKVHRKAGLAFQRGGVRPVSRLFVPRISTNNARELVLVWGF